MRLTANKTSFTVIRRVLGVYLGLLGIVGNGIAADIPISVSTQLDTSLATIGDPVFYQVQLNYPQGTEFKLPALGPKLGQFEIQDQLLTPPERSKSGMVRSWTLKLAAFDTGKITIPPLEIRAYSDGDTSKVLVFKTDQKVVEVFSVLPPGQADLKDIKPPLPLPRVIPWDWIIFIFLILAIAVSWYYCYRKWHSKDPAQYFEPQYLEPPAVIAHRKLTQLKKNYSALPDKRRDFYFGMSQILRAYLERRFYILALEMSTDEIVGVLTATQLDQEQTQKLEEIFNQLDRAKFASIYPRKDQDFNIWTEIYQWIEETRREYLFSQRSGLTAVLEQASQDS